MSEALHGLWPTAVDVTSVVPPAVILREQASVLGERTKGLVRAEVESTEQAAAEIDEYLADVVPADARVVHSHTLYLVAPALDNYRYSLLSVTHDFSPYPCDARFHPCAETARISSEAEFRQYLGYYLKKTETVRIVHALISRVQQLGKSSA